MIVAHYLSILVVAVLLAHPSNGEFRSYDGYRLIFALPSNPSHLSALRNFSKHYDASGHGGVQFWRLRPQEEVKQYLKHNRIPHYTAVRDFGKQIMRENEAWRSRDEPMEQYQQLDEFDLGRFHSFDSILRYLQMVAHSHPDFARFGSIGRTFEGLQLPILTLGYSSRNDSSAKKPSLLVDAGIHAREWIAPAVALHFVNALINDPQFHSLLHHIDVHVIPVLNPDGYVYSRDKDRLWRGTRSGPRKSDAQKCPGREEDDAFCVGADPNRNFPYHWDESGTSQCPCSQVFSGDQPLSETECADLAKFLQDNRGSLKAYLTLHSYGNLIIHTWNFKPKTYPDNVKELRSLAKRMAEAIVKAGGTQYEVGTAPDILYSAAGGSDDYAQSLGIKYVYTMELSSGYFGGKFRGFLFPEEQINDEAAKILPGIRILAEKVRDEARDENGGGKMDGLFPGGCEIERKLKSRAGEWDGGQSSAKVPTLTRPLLSSFHSVAEQSAFFHLAQPTFGGTFIILQNMSPNASSPEAAEETFLPSDHHVLLPSDQLLWALSLFFSLLMASLCVVGAVMNSISLFIYSRPAFRKRSINVLLCGLSASDLALCVLALPVFSMSPLEYFMPGLPPALTGHLLVFCYPVTLMAQTMSVWMLVGITVDRFIAVCYPFSVRIYCTVRRAQLTIGAILLFSVGYNLIRFWEYRINPSDVPSEPVNAATMLSQFLVPLCVLCALNFQVASAILAAVEQRREMWAEELSAAEQREHKTAKMMLMVVLVFLFCYSLSFCLNVLEIVLPDLFRSQVGYLLNDVNNILIVLNSSSSFVFYAQFSSRYRAQLVYLLRQFRCVDLLFRWIYGKKPVPYEGSPSGALSVGALLGKQRLSTTVLSEWSHRTPSPFLL
uniref:G-protein coupled receptors family 1 profile domain-containing protein n=1 Tax=Globodera rostochiensis TaxID=31243 RepID=A0A914HEV4_GLORO